ncbi:MAG: hypothetical protein FXF47_00490 [Candidatus Mcinerneyibacterium aminivorans]|jgi:hypothetical protein|uniref:Uncharacterized protein n=1 Tax=Candidatus Mcinerneyibacterium aminivorans TaxID=2703815 RepID=A0A5D0MEI5_9BACT|nr:MAG: hypothetical protein FXF47_00490 [Candidatus Mcinerneyibacterium aminivorans]
MNKNYDNLIRLLNKAAVDHHVYEQNRLNGKYDENWAEWYSIYLINNGINDYTEEKLNIKKLKEVLLEVTKKFKQSNYKQDWGDLVAKILLE